MSITRRQAATLMDCSSRHVARLLDESNVPSQVGPGGVRVYPKAAFDEWWRQRQLRGYDRAANLGPFRRRATDAEGQQVCPGLDPSAEVSCGRALGRTATGRPRRLCDACRARADREKANRRAAREAARRLEARK